MKRNHCLYIVVLALLAILSQYAAGANSHYKDKRQKINKRILRHRRNRSDKPNIVLILTDDQDLLLGSMKAMPKTTSLLQDHGAVFDNSFTSTPMCCPSRSSLLTGMYPHNHNTYTNNDNCSSIQWQQTHETRSFATYLSDQGYRTGYFGKYLNEYNGTYIPPGWQEWVGLIKNSRFYNYTINFNGKKIKHGDNYYKDYLTDLIANDSVTFLKQSKQYFQTRPVLMVLSVPAPHGPEVAAPQYQHMFANNTDHQIPSWNYAPNPDKQWLLQVTGPMLPVHKKFTNLLQQRRLQTLQSVDDLVEKVHDELKMLGELDNTYIIYTSDHGYHIGHYGLVKGKAMPYDFDVRIPLLVRGPGIKPKTVIRNIVVNVDIAPTILDIAGVEVPEHMDGKSILKLLKSAKNPFSVDDQNFVSTRKPWRDTILLERGKVTKRQLKLRHRKEKQEFWTNAGNLANTDLHYYMTGKMRNCHKREYRLPCEPNQKWYCIVVDGKPRKHKCRSKYPPVFSAVTQNDQPITLVCPCKRKLNRQERKKQRRFLHEHVNKDFRPRFLRNRRSINSLHINPAPAAIDLKKALSYEEKTFNELNLLTRRCRVLPNNTISCDQQLYQDPSAWLDHKEKIDEMIKEYRKALEDLRDIRRHLKKQKPYEDVSDYDVSPNRGLLSEKINYNAADCNCNNDAVGTGKPSFIDPIKEDKLRRRMRRKRKKLKKKSRKTDCNSPNMNCFHHDNHHWQTPPYWTSKPVSRRKLQRRFNHPNCAQKGMECSIMSNHHWKTAPFWTYGPFCFCPNANNNTYWCLRTINTTHNFLYCEFITNFISFYNFIDDPHQLHNTVHNLNYGVLQQLHESLSKLRACKGGRECTIRAGQGVADLNVGRSKDFPISGDGDNSSRLFGDKFHNDHGIP